MAGLVYGVAVDADLDLGLPATTRPPEVTVLGADAPADPAAIHPLPGSGSGPWTGARLGVDFLLTFNDEAELRIAADGSRIAWYAPDTSEATLVHLVLDHALPYCLMRRGRVVLHGSCLVAPGGGCYAVTGRSGAGKSTLAAALRAAGHRFLGDDCVAVTLDGGVPTVAPAYPGLRLDSRSTGLVDVSDLIEAGPVADHIAKRRLAVPASQPWYGEDGYRLRAVFVLTDSDPDDAAVTTAGGGGGSRGGPVPGAGAGPAVGRAPDRTVPDGCGGTLAGAAALLALLPHSFHIGDSATDRAGLLDRLATVAESCAVERLVYRHAPGGLDRATTRIREVLDRLPAPT